MRYPLGISLILTVAACSPTTDISRTSSEVFAGRARYEVVRQDASGDALRVRVKVASMRAARAIAEDLVVQKRGPFARVDVEILRTDAEQGAAPAAVLRWSQAGGFSYAETR